MSRSPGTPRPMDPGLNGIERIGPPGVGCVGWLCGGEECLHATDCISRRLEGAMANASMIHHSLLHLEVSA